MKHVIFILLLTLCPLWAQANSPRANRPGLSAVQADRIAQKVEQTVQEQTVDAEMDFFDAQEALAKVMEEYPPEMISWQQFKKLNQNAKERDLVSRRMDLKDAQQDKNTYKAVFHNFWPNYEFLLKRFKYIFIGESHGTNSTPAEMIRMMQAVRKQHPDKRILLASEFAMVPDLETFPLQRAGSSVDIVQVYPEVKQAADALGIDQLALDDILGAKELYLWKEGKTTFLLAKTGRYLIQRALPRQEEENIINFLQETNMLVGTSPFGLLERNRQWARYIQAVQPFYDIIIVYCGSGHVVGTASTDLPNLLHVQDRPDTGFLFLVPTEYISPETIKFYTDAEEASRAQNLDILEAAKQLEKEQDQIVDSLSQQATGEWTDRTKPFWGESFAFIPHQTWPQPSNLYYIYLPETGVKMPQIKPLPKKEAPAVSQPQKEQPAAKQPKKLRTVPPTVKGIRAPKPKNPDNLRYGNSYI